MGQGNQLHTGKFSVTRSSPTSLLIIICCLLVFTVYVWLISIGHWTPWPATSNYYYYDSLATSFSKGQLSLETKPDPNLLTLANPYDPDAHSGMYYPQDVSFYGGKFYLYFGPAPALLLVIIKPFIPGIIGDQYLVFAFISGIFLLQSLLIIKTQRRYFPGAPTLLIGLIILMAGLMCPLVWILDTPTINNAAITAGQFFFLAGFYLAFSTLEDISPSTWKMIFTGLFWAAAIGSRMTQILPVAFMTIIILTSLILNARRNNKTTVQFIPAMLALSVTLGMGLAILGWYNWARFNSVFESGLHYQLVNMDLQKNGSKLFSPAYVLQNLYVYFLNPLKLGFPFPYISPIKGIRSSIIPFISLPDIYYTQDSVGILYNFPFVAFALIPAISLFVKRSKASLNEDQFFLRWLIIGLGGSFISAFVGLAIFFWVAERYMLDFMPSLTLLSVIGFLQMDQHLARRPIISISYRTLGIILIVITIVVSLLLALSINAAGFRSLNPLLWRQLSNVFRNWELFKRLTGN